MTTPSPTVTTTTTPSPTATATTTSSPTATTTKVSGTNVTTAIQCSYQRPFVMIKARAFHHNKQKKRIRAILGKTSDFISFQTRCFYFSQILTRSMANPISSIHGLLPQNAVADKLKSRYMSCETNVIMSVNMAKMNLIRSQQIHIAVIPWKMR